MILDVMPPRLSGVEVLRRVRRASAIPIIMLTAKGDDVDRVVGLELGAGDYVAKPYFLRELVARLRAVLRRRPRVAGPVESGEPLRLGRLAVDADARHATHGERTLDLTASEFNLLVALLRAGRRVSSKDELSLKVLGRRRESYDRSIDVHVNNLRQKLAALRDAAAEIETVRGIGHRLRSPS